MKTKTLYLLRHAQADIGAGLDDKDRPLSAAGIRHAQALAAKMAQDGLRPDFIVCSTARRTRETGGAVLEAFPGVPAQYRDDLYLADTGPLYEVIKAIEDRYNAVLLVGHNPGIQGLATFLEGGGDKKTVRRIAAGYPAGGLTVFRCDCKAWQDLMPAANQLETLLIGEEFARA